MAGRAWVIRKLRWPLSGIRACSGLREELGQSDQVVGGGGQFEHPADPLDALVTGLAQGAGGLDPAEAFLDALAEA